MNDRREIPDAADAAPYASARMQAGGKGLRPAQGTKLVLALAGPPAAWVIHFLGGYVIVALWCAQRWGGTGVALALLTIVAAAGGATLGALALRLWRHGQAALVVDAEPGGPGPWDARMGERGARMSFLAVLACLMAALFTFLIILEGMPALFADACPATTLP